MKTLHFADAETYEPKKNSQNTQTQLRTQTCFGLNCNGYLANTPTQATPDVHGEGAVQDLILVTLSRVRVEDHVQREDVIRVVQQEPPIHPCILGKALMASQAEHAVIILVIRCPTQQH
jgi:hypothetical protein